MSGQAGVLQLLIRGKMHIMMNQGSSKASIVHFLQNPAARLAMHSAEQKGSIQYYWCWNDHTSAIHFGISTKM